MDDIIVKIKKLMNTANDPNASENEVFVAVKKAHKLMAKHNIELNDIESKTEDDVIEAVLDITPNFMMSILQVVSDEFRCEFLYISRKNRFIPKIYGLKNDVDAAVEVIKNITVFINNELPRYVKKYKKKASYNFTSVLQDYIPCDARVLKRSYYLGFANRLNEFFNENKLELKQEFEKYELISLGVPKIVTDYVNNVVKPKKVKSKELAVSGRAFNAGVIACDKYNGR